MIWNFKLRNYFVAILAMFCLISCEKDNVEPLHEESLFPEIKGRVISVKDLVDKPIIYNRLVEYLQKPVAKSSLGIELDTTYIKVMETNRYTSYIFKIQQDSIERNQVLRNFMLTYVNDTTQIQHLVNYLVLPDGSFDMDNIQLQRLYGDDLLDTNPFTAKCSAPETIWYSYQECYTIEGHDCTCPEGSSPDEIRCVTRWASIDVEATTCIGSGDAGGLGNPQNNGTGQGTGGDSQSNDDDSYDDDDPGDDQTADDILIGFDPNEGGGLVLVDPNLERVKEIISDLKFKETIKNLELSLGGSRELGFSYRPGIDGFNETPYRGTTDKPTQILILIGEETEGAAHIHLRKIFRRSIDVITGNEIITPETPIPMFSFLDVDWYSDLIMSKIKPDRTDLENTLAVQKTFMVVVTTEGNYMLKYEGPLESFSTSTTPDPNSTSPAEVARFADFAEIYIQQVSRKPETSFLNYLSTTMNGIGYALYKFDRDGNVIKL